MGILNSVFLLEDTTDGLFSSVAPDKLPNSTQFAAIAATSKETEWTTSSPKVNDTNDDIDDIVEQGDEYLTSVAKVKTGIIIQDHKFYDEDQQNILSRNSCNATKSLESPAGSTFN